MADQITPPVGTIITPEAGDNGGTTSPATPPQATPPQESQTQSDDLAEAIKSMSIKEVQALTLQIAADRSDKNKRLKAATESLRQKDEQLKSQEELKARLEALEREKMTDDERKRVDEAKRLEREEESKARIKMLEIDNLKLRIDNAINAAGKAKDREFVEYKIEKYLADNPEATAEDLLAEAVRVKEANPTAFETQTALDSAGGGGGITNTNTAVLRAEYKKLDEEYQKNLRSLSPQAGRSLLAKMVAIERKLGGRL